MKPFKALLALVLVGLLWSSPSQVAAQTAPALPECVNPGDLITIPRVRNPPPIRATLFLDFGDFRVRVLIRNVTASSFSFRMPRLQRTPRNGEFELVVRLLLGVERTLRTGRICQGRLLEEALDRIPDVPIRPATGNEVAAPSGGPEYVLAGTDQEIARARVVLRGARAQILRSQRLGSLGQSLLFVDLAGALTEAQARALLAREGIRSAIGTHTVYSLSQSSGGRAGLRLFATALVRPDPGRNCTLTRPVRVGLIDGPLDLRTPSLTNVRVTSLSVLRPRERPGSTAHGTGIAALIAGQATTQGPAGLAPGAELLSVVAFARAGGRDLARLENIALGLDWLVERGADVVNMSLAGPPNEALAALVEIADQQGLIMVAAAGNRGEPSLGYPAADPRVLAITAIDADKRIYRRASFGAGMDFSAPGVDIAVPDRRGWSYRSGTSYAAAVATGLVAQKLAQQRLTTDQLRASFRRSAEDLGPSGYDPRFGWGLMRGDPC
ncbi:subtilisin DY [Dinoroseobacter shibae DFL 12 = DSM 16493]|jgi:hypothetical protein|uniref:Subtilisin DY n=1 Tax=Dinoroseobacter shibae (strain DSM 16493 / NCIMB 14021 / DFL 12) TaxID=398580 RepID=A8LP89_DINSH|nr:MULTISPECIES: S8 family serine peptidase [Dinoroseobacter]ABV95154.1 subtilisin DY [Dinoroseobacter shibae DFL 12 = DSM 16493]MDD9718127.1 S8 family serine peptidase [Dinoroseobacter sp. PD6]URF46567.1 S8 family serine peptidase [Dinoroseobacter shibae]URF50873.1 S8 family serine peptidase [Dinoroseobacter shibae]